MIITESLKYHYHYHLVSDLAVDLISDNDDDDDEIFVCEEADKPEQLGSNPF